MERVSVIAERQSQGVPAERTTIAIVEDHGMVRELLVRMLSSQDGFEVAGAVGSIAEATTVIEQGRPDVVLLDIVLPDGSGIEWARDLKMSHPEIKILFLTAYHEEEILLDAINAGAEGYMVKTSSCERLVDAVRAVASGEHVFDPSIAAPILERMAKIHYTFRDTASENQAKGLSAREREIAALASNGLTNKEIAKVTSVSVNTVKTHLRRIYQHLNVTSRRELLEQLKGHCN